MKCLLGIFLIGAACSSWAQVPVFRNPLDTPVQLSSNFGEVRTDHFHTGYDYRTNGKRGLPVYAAADGYVSRIKVSATGYGKVVYLIHPGNFMTVYAHLDSFNSALGAYVRAEQYRRQSFEIELFPEPNRFYVRQGQTIGYSGNSGSSSGPHLHFEIRDASGESFPLNPYPFLPVPDTVTPVLSKLILYPQRQGCAQAKSTPVPLRKRHGNWQTIPDSVVSNDPVIGLGIQVKDFFNGMQADQGIYRLTAEMDDRVVFELRFDRLVFGNGRYVNAHIDYAAFSNDGQVIHKLYREPGDHNTIYTQLVDDGYLDLGDQQWHRVVVRAADAAGNEAVLAFHLRYSGTSSPAAENNSCLRHDAPFSYNDDSLRILIPSGAVYRNSIFRTVKQPRRSAFSAYYQIGLAEVPLHREMDIAILPSRILPTQWEKMVIVRLNNGQKRALPTQKQDQWLKASSRSFGTFVILADTSAPRIVPLNVRPYQRLTGRYIHLEGIDDLTGISSYAAYLNDEWILMEYDPKIDRFTVVIDQMLPEGPHRLRVQVADAVGNQTIYELAFLK
ncbi:MAG: M23 family metallopeptidase [Chitinophagales bacterium]|nr:M23 family metallopeptidase [Chitinophagales bacterium]MDW8428855.1 M23 family metallopeptidase [Chitinophagales bacterium]